MPPTLAHWQEWRALCALQRCGPETTAALRSFAWLRFQRCARAVLGEAAGKARTPMAADCWHLLETQLAVGRNRGGRRYKEWLFARLEGSSGAPLDVVQGGATLLLRSVARQFLAREAAPDGTLSLDAPAPGAPEGAVLAAYVAAPADETLERNEMAGYAVTVAERVFAGLDARARLILLAKRLELPLYHPDVLAVARASRSRASEIWRAAYRRLADETRRLFPAEPPDYQMRLTLEASGRLGEIIFHWGGAEIEARPLFLLVEGRT